MSHVVYPRALWRKCAGIFFVGRNISILDFLFAQQIQLAALQILSDFGVCWAIDSIELLAPWHRDSPSIWSKYRATEVSPNELDYGETRLDFRILWPIRVKFQKRPAFSCRLVVMWDVAHTRHLRSSNIPPRNGYIHLLMRYQQSISGTCTATINITEDRSSPLIMISCASPQLTSVQFRVIDDSANSCCIRISLLLSINPQTLLVFPSARSEPGRSSRVSCVCTSDISIFLRKLTQDI